ncbi:hypothetical protein [Roseitranquillus sediminis]|nr:hypothetical protein [Roseitranquillus sediminis]
MGRKWKALITLLVLGFLAFVVFAYLGDLSPETVDVNQPVTLDAD